MSKKNNNTSIQPISTESLEFQAAQLLNALTNRSLKQVMADIKLVKGDDAKDGHYAWVHILLIEKLTGFKPAELKEKRGVNQKLPAYMALSRWERRVFDVALEIGMLKIQKLLQLKDAEKLSIKPFFKTMGDVIDAMLNQLHKQENN